MLSTHTFMKCIVSVKAYLTGNLAFLLTSNLTDALEMWVLMQTSHLAA